MLTSRNNRNIFKTGEWCEVLFQVTDMMSGWVERDGRRWWKYNENIEMVLRSFYGVPHGNMHENHRNAKYFRWRCIKILGTGWEGSDIKFGQCDEYIHVRVGERVTMKSFHMVRNTFPQRDKYKCEQNCSLLRSQIYFPMWMFMYLHSPKILVENRVYLAIDSSQVENPHHAINVRVVETARVG